MVDSLVINSAIIQNKNYLLCNELLADAVIFSLTNMQQLDN